EPIATATSVKATRTISTSDPLLTIRPGFADERRGGRADARQGCDHETGGDTTVGAEKRDRERGPEGEIEATERPGRDQRRRRRREQRPCRRRHADLGAHRAQPP